MMHCVFQRVGVLKTYAKMEDIATAAAMTSVVCVSLVLQERLVRNVSGM